MMRSQFCEKVSLQRHFVCRTVMLAVLSLSVWVGCLYLDKGYNNIITRGTLTAKFQGERILTVEEFEIRLLPYFYKTLVNAQLFCL